MQYSKRRVRVMNRLSVAELKRLVKKPEMVEWVDVTALDPRLLVDLKSYRGAVPVPAHWAQKRDYLGSKKGMEKAKFQLPTYIADTGIGIQREAIHEKEAGQSLKAKTRERVQPKMGKINIDYQKLHDAFFKYQVPPKMSRFGEMCVRSTCEGDTDRSGTTRARSSRRTCARSGRASCRSSSRRRSRSRRSRRRRG